MQGRREHVMHMSNMHSMRSGVTGMGKGEMKLSRVTHIVSRIIAPKAQIHIKTRPSQIGTSSHDINGCNESG